LGRVSTCTRLYLPFSDDQTGMSSRPQVATGSAMPNVQTIALVGLFAVVARIAYPTFSSPWVLLAVSPLLIFLLGLVFLVLHIVVSHRLDATARKGRYTITNASRPFAFSTPAAWQAVVTRSHWSQTTSESPPPLYPPSPAVSSEVNELLQFIIRDFVLTWYSGISESPTFPSSVQILIHGILDKLIHRAEEIDIPSLVVKRIIPKITAHIDQFRQSEVALRGAGLERRLTQSEELDLLLASRYTTGKDATKLHSAVDNLSTTFTKQSEEAHLRRLVRAVLPLLLPEAEGQSTGLKIVAREIAACAVLYPVMEMLSDPDFWNRIIDQLVSILSCNYIEGSYCLGWSSYSSAVSTSMPQAPFFL
jgi:sorting nexin-25